jgi:hypothetical protein
MIENMENKNIRHLTLTGSFAGQTLCGAERNGAEVHATYCPIDKAEFRAETCQHCLMEYAMSFDDEEMATAPAWVVEMRKAS